VKFVSFWENAPTRRMPPYVALALASLHRSLGEDFVLLGAKDVELAVGHNITTREWRFGQLDFEGSPEALSIVAKSDYIRMAYVYRHGGYWLDADTIALCNPKPGLELGTLDDRLHWYSEALFGARPGNSMLQTSVDQCWESSRHMWGNPGGIRDLVDLNTSRVRMISPALLDPGFRPAYRFPTCDVMLDTTVHVDEFLSSSSVKLLKLYNTYFSRTYIGDLSVSEFLKSGTLLSRIFLHIEPSADEWIARCSALEDSLKARS